MRKYAGVHQLPPHSTTFRHHARWSSASFKLPRSPSSPSPPARRPFKKARAQPARRQSHASAVRPPPGQPSQPQGWSTSYQAGSSRYVLLRFTRRHGRGLCSMFGTDSSDSEDLTSEDNLTDAARQDPRGRRPTQRRIGQFQPNDTKGTGTGTFITRQGSGQSLSSNSRRSSPSRLYERRTFTRSRSPAVKPPSDSAVNGTNRPASPSLFSRNRNNSAVAIRSLFPSTVCIHVRIPGTRCKVSFDTRQALENILLLCSVGYSAVKIQAYATCPFDPDTWISIGKGPPSLHAHSGDVFHPCWLYTRPGIVHDLKRASAVE